MRLSPTCATTPREGRSGSAISTAAVDPIILIPRSFMYARMRVLAAPSAASAAFTRARKPLGGVTSRSANASQTVIKFWCAKEALSKALGTGIRYSPKEIVVADYLSDAGLLTMRLNGAWAEAFKNLRGRDLQVSVRTVQDHALASCFIPASLFDE